MKVRNFKKVNVSLSFCLQCSSISQKEHDVRIGFRVLTRLESQGKP